MEMYQVIVDDEAPFKLFYTFSPGEKMTHDYPGSSDEVEIYQVTLFGIELSKFQFNAFVEHYGQSELDQECIDDVYYQKKEQAEYLADIKYQERRDGYVDL